ncbi:AI-2E family transporter [Nocardioides sp. GY 10113]|uniref:AI-2E family transporter n=1 Tax=Nocardioides sp. GY 10113 TaxID=2569761 RepID=UPI0010A8739C|nr:AI-2E family transporter [Nocardioides sp. GY 10113]TIC88846.1 AI-2E family transporter [Nocardioides sp. GY 10113]
MTTEPQREAARSGLPRGVLILLGLASAVVAVAGMKAVAGILAPAALALMLAIAADPIRTWLVGRGWPRTLGTLVTLLVVYVGLLAFIGAMIVALARFAALVPDYKDELNGLLDNVRDLLDSLGVHPGQIDTMLQSLDLGKVTSLLGGLLGSILSLGTNIAFIAALILFMAVDADPFVRNLGAVSADRAAFTGALSSFARGTRRYLVVSTVFGLIVAVIDTGVLWALGVPGAVLWGLLAFITNYVPNIGFVLGLIPPAVLALLEGGWSLMLWVIIAYCVINVVIQSVIQPKIVGDAVGISASITFLSLVVWAWILGPLGAVLAVPMTLLVKSVFVDADPNARWISGLIGSPLDEPAPAAGDPPSGPGDPAAEASGA